ncbi:MAG: L-threonylcarbamoyladenylate synthase [Paenibacillus dendritiformis]|uniref:L-threonylcarbamoyladenylate synthase n=1 Tax=Paenibacillus dendritiformis TaxID=130049 RepID=UPI00143D8DB6|nr:L-threonylcarbamoyladenylate synthase [Paenibacillus dendritiformis]MDU5141471.1 L-threonylcarbamoyladenylate synthase [Paenibacillus dendritiformis]NKI24124.1 threonylcarbamoyl-AMP synthase [Paenibacillus dendritiformis]NRG00962.1 threonylcarbamoyl-AMP synthase [Paenibacillus dendritiformis]
MNVMNRFNEPKLADQALEVAAGHEGEATKRWTVDAARPLDGQPAIVEAAALLAAGGTVAFPTETVYGLGADARDTQAVERIFAAKGRPSDNPLIVHIADMAMLDELVEPFGGTARRLMERFWPGPLTIVLPVRPGAVSPRVTAGLDTVGVRMPAHDTALALIRTAACPVAAPSANRSGRPSPTRAEHVAEDLDGRIGGIVDGGPTGVGVESTVVELHGDRIHVLRPGGVTTAMLREIAAEVTIDPAVDPDGALAVPAAREDGEALAAPRSPGMKYAHYAPQGMLAIVKSASPEAAARRIQEELDAARERGERTGVLAFTEQAADYRADVVVPLGSVSAPEEAAHRLYEGLRRFDEEGVGFIMAEACSTEGIGLAVMNRLLKAAGHRVIRC